jgi:hypothetical protein
MGSWIWPSVSLAAGRAQVTSVGLTIPTDVLLGAWDLFGVLEMNFDDGGDECCMDFFHGSSAFYPDFGAYLESRVRDRLQDQAE